MVRIGIAGLGFMGKMHFRCYKALDGVEIAAVCDVDEAKLEAGAAEAGNIAGAEEPLDLGGVALYHDFDQMLKDSKLDAVSITLPTYLHCEHTVKALQAGLNVFCEKPMALETKACDTMIAAAEKSGKILQIGHCIRFWPEYAKTKQIIDSKQYGLVKVATFQRLSMPPTWAWDDWIVNETRGGGAIIDLHIHDADYIQYTFGMPQSVFTRAARGPGGSFDHALTSYIYEDGKVITAEGGWMMTPAFGFEMSFNIILEQATITYDCTRKPAFKVCPAEGDAIIPEVESGDGYSLEIAYFVKRLKGEKVVEVVTPGQSRDSLRLVLAEKSSAQMGKQVPL